MRIRGDPMAYSTIMALPDTIAGLLARRIVGSLRDRGFPAYLVGGCVRDLLLGRVPKDYDVATGARPDDILRLFPRARQVGAHFGVMLVAEDDAQVEVATFRSDHAYRDGRHPELYRIPSMAGAQILFHPSCSSDEIEAVIWKRTSGRAQQPIEHHRRRVEQQPGDDRLCRRAWRRHRRRSYGHVCRYRRASRD